VKSLFLLALRVGQLFSLNQWLSCVDVVQPKYVHRRPKVDEQPNVVGSLDLADRWLAMVLEVVGVPAPVDLPESPQQAPHHDPVPFVNRSAAVDCDDWQDQLVPQVVLGSHDLVEDDKSPRLHQQAHPQIIIEHNACRNHAQPLRNECQYADQRAVRLIKELVNQVEVNRVVVAVVLANEVIQVPLVQKLVAIDVVEQTCKADERTSRHNREDKSVIGEEALLRYYGLEWLLLGEHFVVHINPKVEHKRVDDRVDLEVHGKTVPEAANDELSLEEVVHRN